MYYSQCEEDQYLNDNFFKNKQNGVYIELGHWMVLHILIPSFLKIR